MKPLNKAQEKELYREIVAKCPAGYVRDILSDCQLEVERAITDDFGFIDFAGRRKEIEEHRSEMNKQDSELARVKAEISELSYKELTLKQGLDVMRKEIGKFTGLVHQLSKL